MGNPVSKTKQQKEEAIRDVFIAHVEEDAEVALEIALGLEEAGYTTWCYEVDSIPGPSYLIQTGEAIEQSKAVILVISPHSLGSRQITKEVVRASERSKEFIPVRRDITHVEFQNRQPEWRQAVGAAASIGIPRQGVAGVLPRIIDGLKNLGIHPGFKTDSARIAQIRRVLSQLPGRIVSEEPIEPPPPTKKPEIEPSVKPRVNQGIQPRSRSAALKWGTGILFVLTVMYLIALINLTTLSLWGYAVPFLPGYFITFFIALAAAIYAVRRKHWGYVLVATIWLLVAEIIGTSNLLGGGGPGAVLPGDIAFQIFALLLVITCLILVSRTKAEFS